MTTQRLATELMEHIIDMLGDGPREECLPALLACSTTNSALLNTSQKHVFRNVTLHSYEPETYHWFQGTTPEVQAQCERTRLFLRSVVGNSRLSSYVKELSCRFNDGSFCDSKFIHTVVQELRNVVHFTIGAYKNHSADPGSVVGIRINQNAFNDMVALLRQTQLETLRLESLSSFSLEALRVAPGLKTLILHDCGGFPVAFIPPAE